MFRLTQNLTRGLVRQLKFQFGTNPLSKYLTQNNQLQNSLRFELQNKNWTFEELNRHSTAFAKGIIELGIEKGSKILLWVEKSHTAEIVATQLGAALSGTIVVPSVAKTLSELQADIQSSGCSVLIYSPNSQTSEKDKKYLDLIVSTFPEIEKLQNGEAFSSKKYPNLKLLVSTGFYHQNGTIKFRDLLSYDNLQRVNLPDVQPTDTLFLVGGKSITLQDCLKIAENQKPSSTGLQISNLEQDARIPNTFATGPLSSLVNGNFVVFNLTNTQQPSSKDLETL